MMQSLIQRISLLTVSSGNGTQSVRLMSRVKRRSTHPPYWWVRKTRTLHEEDLTPANEGLVKEAVAEKYSPARLAAAQSPLREDPSWQRTVWTPESRRTGVITRKIGVLPAWKDNGEKFFVTLLQVVDNHVIRYIEPEEWIRTVKGAAWYKPFKGPPKMGVLVVGAESTDPRLFTKEYTGLFEESGVMPKMKLTRFFITPDAKIMPGTPLFANHFRAGDYVDVYGKTIDRGFQGVMKRWGFAGMPKTHGQTKTHRRPGNIGGGGEKARVWPGKKMPGHMGSERRTMKGLKIWRINAEHNVLYVQGLAVPGETNSYVYVHDSILNARRLGSEHNKDKSAFENPPPFPTFFPEEAESIEEETYAPGIHRFHAPSITFSESS